MTDKLAEFLKKNETQLLLNSNDFPQLFNSCPTNIKKELLQTLDDSHVVITGEKGYYGLKGYNTIGCLIKDKRSKNYALDFLSDKNEDNKELMVAFQDYESALRFTINTYAGRQPFLLDDFFVLEYKWVELKIPDVDYKTLVTQEAIDRYDEDKIKDKRLRDAAKEEFEYIVNNEILVKALDDKSKLIDELRKWFGDYTINWEYQNTSIRINIPKLDSDSEKDAINIIKKYLKLPADIKIIGKSVFIQPEAKRIKRIKDKVEAEFGVKI